MAKPTAEGGRSTTLDEPVNVTFDDAWNGNLENDWLTSIGDPIKWAW